jgi:hypothetical protein
VRVVSRPASLAAAPRVVTPASPAAWVLTALTLLFLVRVVGQALVVFAGVRWLPPVESWYSGLLPYPVLLPAQIVILAAQAVLDRAAWTGRPWLVRPRPRAARRLRWFSYAYALAMAVRWVVTGTHAIPVLFHWVLAAYLVTLAGLWRPAAAPSASRTRLAAAR